MSDKIEGVFVREKAAKIGTGHTEKKVVQKMYCLAKDVEDNEVEIRYLGSNDQPIGEPERIPRDEFIHKFIFQPYYLEKKAVQKKSKVNKRCAVAEEHARRKEYHSAEYEFKNALKIDEENLRANFGIGNVYLELGEKQKAKDIFVKLSQIDAIFKEENKHFFNECAIQLRKQELFDESTGYYRKALKLSPRDENLYFNLARAYLEKGDREKATASINKAFEIKPDFKEGKVFVDYMEQRVDEEAVDAVADAEKNAQKESELKEAAKKQITEAAQKKLKDAAEKKAREQKLSKGFGVKKV